MTQKTNKTTDIRMLDPTPTEKFSVKLEVKLEFPRLPSGCTADASAEIIPEVPLDTAWLDGLDKLLNGPDSDASDDDSVIVKKTKPRQMMMMPKKPAAAKLIKTIGKKQTKASPSFREKQLTHAPVLCKTSEQTAPAAAKPIRYAPKAAAKPVKYKPKAPEAPAAKSLVAKLPPTPVPPLASVASKPATKLKRKAPSVRVPSLGTGCRSAYRLPSNSHGRHCTV
jgi:hypothetical protein